VGVLSLEYLSLLYDLSLPRLLVFEYLSLYGDLFLLVDLSLVLLELLYDSRLLLLEFLSLDVVYLFGSLDGVLSLGLGLSLESDLLCLSELVRLSLS